MRDSTGLPAGAARPGALASNPMVRRSTGRGALTLAGSGVAESYGGSLVVYNIVGGGGDE